MNEPIPPESQGDSLWRRINGPFAHVLITSKKCISRDIVASANSTLSDGYLMLQFIRAGPSIRTNLAKTFMKISDGKHFDYDFVEWMPIRAFRIVPRDSQGNLMVDGERVPFGKFIRSGEKSIPSILTLGPIQGEILPGIARCMGKEPPADTVLTDPPATA